MSIALLLLAAIMLSACPAEVIDPDPVDPEDPELPVDPVDPGDPGETVRYVMQTVALQGLVTNAAGAPLSGVKVTTGTASATTGSDGMYTLDKAGTLDGRAVVRYEKSGYFAVTRSRTKADDMRIEAMLHPRGNTAISSSETSPASGAKTVTAGGLKIELPANAFATADGKEYTGTVHADILFMGIDNPGTELMMPGSDLTTSAEGEMMIPAGMADAVFTGDNGKLLRIADKTEATVTYTLPAGINAADLPATVPLWTFDEARGYWKEEGAATRQGNAYTGKVSHFSPRGAGFKSRLANINVTVTECDDKPAYWSEITLSETYDEDDALAPLSRDDFRVPRGPFYIDTYGFTNVAVPARSLVRVTASWHGSRKTQTVRMGAGDTSTNVHFEFEEDCEEEEEEEDIEDDDRIPERCALYKIVLGEHVYNTWDNHLKRYRTDSYGTGDPVHTIDNRIAGKSYVYYYKPFTTGSVVLIPAGWYEQDRSYTVTEPDELRDEVYLYHFTYDDNSLKTQGYKKRPQKEMILGKPCSVWENKYVVIYKWKRILMRRETIDLQGKTTVSSEVLGITVNVPADACDPGPVDPKWIQK